MDRVQYIFEFLAEKIGNNFGAAAVIGNLYVESKLDPECLEGRYSRKWGLTGKEYTRLFDTASGREVDTFTHDGAGYGLAQWTYWSRKKSLWEYAQNVGKSVGDLDTQLGFLWKEIQTYKTVMTAIRNATNIREASDVVCKRYEKPEHTEEKYLQNRANWGQKFYDQYAIKMEENIEENGEERGMNSAAYVDEQIQIIKTKGIPLADQVWETGRLCVGWPYIYGDRGSYCTSAHRQSVYNSHPSYKTLISKCQVLNGSKGSCSGCKWYPNGQRVRGFDCRGYTYWCLLKFGIKIMGAGATSQWNDASNWEDKGTIDTIPEDKLVCLFYPDKNDSRKMGHTGFGYKGATLECSNGVQYFAKRDKKWTHWAIPKGLYDGVDPSGDTRPTLRKGDKGEYVKLLQTLLIDRGYTLPRYGADGSFGNETLAAVKQFQQDWGIPVDGIVDNKTWDLLESSPERKILYTVTIPHLSKEMAEDLLTKYVGTMQQET